MDINKVESYSTPYTTNKQDITFADTKIAHKLEAKKLNKINDDNIQYDNILGGTTHQKYLGIDGIYVYCNKKYEGKYINERSKGTIKLIEFNEYVNGPKWNLLIENIKDGYTTTINIYKDRLKDGNIFSRAADIFKLSIDFFKIYILD